jgi:hypothetical protein
MTPDQPKAPLQQRIYRELADRFTAQLEGQALSWPAVHAAEGRIRARVRLKLCRLLGAPDTDPGMAEALTVLAGESPAQAASDEALVRRWCQMHGIVEEDADGARARIAQRLETMAARLQAAEARDGWPHETPD